ncbi:hypothetical protein NRS6094_04344 [Bacillus subtilis]|uniref:hypothetical protein n=1 Tax=Bacillus subtilis TaxID=1423 RepID=UPI001B9F4BB3|nr:hypothetical protein [Bacillus subtilis]CAF1778227.1 hypothetical protein NRS6094_04344 [Bacillus subtilis]
MKESGIFCLKDDVYGNKGSYVLNEKGVTLQTENDYNLDHVEFALTLDHFEDIERIYKHLKQLKGEAE